jgi:hypothetical protein
MLTDSRELDGHHFSGRLIFESIDNYQARSMLDTRTNFDQPAIAITWQERLARCRVEEEIIAVVRDYLATWSPLELVELPLKCRPSRMKDGDEITLLAFSLVQASCTETDNAGLARMAAFFGAAATRRAEVLGAAQSPRPVENDCSTQAR